MSRSPRVSAHSAGVPIVSGRSFVLPVSVKGLALARTHHGITTPHLLLLTASDGVLMLDRRLLDPRRPVGEPKDFEKSEGLLQYSAFLPLRHQWLLTHGLALPRAHSLLSAATAFESTTLVAAFGLDVFVARAAPAKAFDQLDPDFNFAVFALLLLAGAAVTLLMGRAADKRDLTQAWL